MKDYEIIVDEFIVNWAVDKNSFAYSMDEISTLEAQIDVRFPDSYRYLVSKYHKVYCPHLLNAIVAGEHQMHDLQNLMSPSEFEENIHVNEDFGLPVEFVAFGNDCMGNLFCFKTDELVESAERNAKIWFFDHDFSTISEEANTFSDFIERFNLIKNA